MQIDIVSGTRSKLGEGPFWVAKEKRLLWVDIDGKAVNVYDPKEDKNTTIELDQKVSVIVPRKAGGALVGLMNGLASLDLDTGKYEILPVSPNPGLFGRRFNDGKCDPKGRLWAGTMLASEPRGPVGHLYCLEPSTTTIHMKVADITISNGLCWSLDHRTFYYIDSTTQVVDAFDYDVVTGRIDNRRTIIRIAPEMGIPDGMTIDTKGKLWVALWQGSKITRWDPDTGKLLLTVDLPVIKPTSIAFGGDDLTDMYVTSAANEGEPYPNGALFRIRGLGVKGVEEPQFDG